MKPELIPLYTETDERAGTLIRYPDGSVKFSQDIKADRNVKDSDAVSGTEVLCLL